MDHRKALPAFLFCALGLVSLACARSVQDKPPPAVPKDAAQEFRDRVDEYAKLRDRVEGGLPKLSDEAQPEEIQQHKQLLAKAIRQERRGARQGEMFAPAVRRDFRTAVGSEVKGKQGKTERTAIEEDKPEEAKEGGPVRLQVNGPYPEHAPLTTVPPEVLQKLPELPEEIEYRFVGRNLILYDSRANLIIDYLEDVLP